MIAIVGETEVEEQDIQRAIMFTQDGLDGDIRRFALAFAQARAVEREACARICDDVEHLRRGYSESTLPAWQDVELHMANCAALLAKRIRARNKWGSPHKGDPTKDG